MPISLSGSLLITGSLTASGTLTAQTLVVQTVTSSISYSSGSNIFGNSSTNTQKFTGSVLISGSSTFSNNITLTGGYLETPWANETRTVWERYSSATYFQRISSNGAARQLRIESNGAYGNASIVLDGQSNDTVTTTIVSDKFVVTGSAKFSSDIQGGGDLYFNKGSRTTIYPTTTNQNLHMKSNGSGVLQFNDDNSGNLTMCIGGGNVGIGNSNPSRKLSVQSTSTPGFFHNNTNVAGSYCQIWQLGGSETVAGSSYYLYCDTDNIGVRVVIYGNGNLANVNNSYGAYSDIKLKENITDATPKLNDLLKVKIRNFNLKGENIKQIGVVAQELEEIFPGLIEESDDTIKNEDGEYIKTGEKTKTVKYSVFVPMLIKAIQEQQAQIESQNTLIQELTTRLTALENK